MCMTVGVRPYCHHWQISGGMATMPGVLERKDIGFLGRTGRGTSWELL